MRYVDSASRKLGDTVYDWLATLLPSARSFACQSGYYRFDALDWFGSGIERILENGGTVDLVVGANEERLSAPDLESTLELLGSHLPSTASLTLVGARDGLFHPKCYYVELADGRRHAAIGSANFTGPGIAHNIEACVLLDDAVDDPGALEEVRSAILAWRERAAAGAADARAVTPQYIRELEAERIIDPVTPRQRSVGARSSTTGRSSFPALGRIAGTPKRRAAKAPSPPKPSSTGTRLRDARAAFPPGVIGIAKRLSARTDVKGFTSSLGTPYIALPANESDLAARLPMKPYGKNGEPRLDLVIEARLLDAAKDVVSSGNDTTNITYVGMGNVRKSNIDLRLNVQHTVMNGLRYVASQGGLVIPKGGDFVTIEFLHGGRMARLSFVTDQPTIAKLTTTLQPGRSWGWLDEGALPPW